MNMNGQKRGDVLWFYNKDSHRQVWIFKAVRGYTDEKEYEYGLTHETTWDITVYKDSKEILIFNVFSDTNLPINFMNILNEFSNYMNGIIIGCAMYGKSVNEDNSDVQSVI